MPLNGLLDKEVMIVKENKQKYLKQTFEFQVSWILKQKEKCFVNKINLYSDIWNKILANLELKLKETTSHLQRYVNQIIDPKSLKSLINNLMRNNKKKAMELYESNFEELMEVVLMEELHIREEKFRREKIINSIKIWQSLFKSVITLFDKVILNAFKGRPGTCSYFLTETIVEKIKKITDEVKLEKLNFQEELKIPEGDEEETHHEISQEKSSFAMGMTVDPPDYDLIMELNLFQIKKLLEETTCVLISKPLLIADYMEDRSVDLKPFSEEQTKGSQYLMNKLSDAYEITERILLDRKRDPSSYQLKPPKCEPYKIETDPAFTDRINSLIKAYRKYPQFLKANI